MKNALLKGLADIPESWTLTPVKGKAPYRSNWNTESPVKRSVIAADIKSGRATGYGLITGQGFVAIDFDGHSALDKYLELSGGIEPPQTVSWTSGKPGRFQLLFQVPESYQGLLTNRKAIATRHKDDQGKQEQLEIRYTACQSVLPPSIHPDTGNYKWINQDFANIAECPGFILELMLADVNAKSEKANKGFKTDKQNLYSNQGIEKPVKTQENLIATLSFNKPSLLKYLPHADRDLILNGAGDGSRNDAARKLSINLQATAERLDDLGLPYLESPEDLYYQFCNRCNPPLDAREADAWYSKALRKSWEPSLDDQALVNCYNAWANRNTYQVIPETNRISNNSNDSSDSQDSDSSTNEVEIKINPSWQRWVDYQKFTPNITIDSQDFEYPEDFDIKGKITYNNSGLGTKKTVATRELLKKKIVEKYGTALWIIPRNRLGDQQVEEGRNEGLAFIRLTKPKDGDKEINILGKIDEYNVVLCPESLYKLDGFFNNKPIIIDECESVLAQISAGGTVKGKEQTLCMAVFKKAMDESIGVIALDANARDGSANLLKKFAPHKELVKIKNLHLPRKQNIILIESITTDEETGEIKINKHDISPGIAKLLVNSCVPAIGVDSLANAKAIDEFLRDGANKHGFCLNSESTSETWGKLFSKNPVLKDELKLRNVHVNLDDIWSDDLMSSPDTFFRKYGGYLIYTPTAESGVSITIQNYFTSKHLMFVGVLATNPQTQMSVRVRDNSIPTYIHCRERSFLAKNNCYSTPGRLSFEFQLQIQQIMSEAFKSGIIPSKEYLVNKLSERLLNDTDKDWYDYTLESDWIREFELNNLRECLLWKFEQMGYSVTIEQQEKNQLGKQIKDIKKSQEESKADLFEVAVPYPSYEQAKKSTEEDGSLENKVRVDKTFILEMLPDIQKSGISMRDYYLDYFVRDKHFYSSMTNYFLLENSEILEKQTSMSLFSQLTQERINQRSIRKLKILPITALKKLGIDRLIKDLANEKEPLEICKDSEIVKNIVERCRRDKSINCIDGFKPGRKTVEKQENISFIKSLLTKVGIKLKSAGQALDENGIKQRWYCLDNESYYSDYRQVTLEGIQKYYEKWLSEKYQKPDWNLELVTSNNNDVKQTENITSNSEKNQSEQDLTRVFYEQVQADSQTIKIRKLAEILETTGKLPDFETDRLTASEMIAIDKCRELFHQEKILATF